MYATNIQKDSITFIVFEPGHERNLEQHSVSRSDLPDEEWLKLRSGLIDQTIDPDEAVRICSYRQGLASLIKDHGNNYMGIQVVDGQIMFNGQPCRNSLSNRILALYREGHDITPWVRHAEKLFRNPRPWVVDELDLWLASSDLPMTPDGDILAYKKVRRDYKDIYTATMDNSVGRVVSVPEQTVDTDRNRTCSSGLHFCSKSYLDSYGSYDPDHYRVVIVKINPEHIVAIPSDYDNAKGRTWRYEVVGEISGHEVKYKKWEAVTYEYGYPSEARIIPEDRATPTDRNVIIPGVGVWLKSSNSASFDDSELGLRNQVYYSDGEYYVDASRLVDDEYSLQDLLWVFTDVVETGNCGPYGYRLNVESREEALMLAYYFAKYNPETPTLSACRFSVSLMDGDHPFINFIKRNLRGINVERYGHGIVSISRKGRSNRNLRWRLAMALVEFASRIESGDAEVFDFIGKDFMTYTDKYGTTIVVSDEFANFNFGVAFTHEIDMHDPEKGRNLALQRALGLANPPVIHN